MSRRWLKIAAIAGGWVLLGAVLSTEVYFNLRAQMKWATFTDIALSQFTRAAMWACLAPLILRLRFRMPLNAGHWIGGVSFHLAASLIMMATYYVGRLVSYVWIFDQPWSGLRQAIWDNFYGHNLVDMAYYWAVLAFGYAADIRRKYRSEELRAAQLEARLIEAELKTLREQLRPHFLFNTLNTVSTLVRERRNDEAVTVLARLGSLLRMSLDRNREPEGTLADEMQFLEHYVDIQRARFPDRLDVRIAIEKEALAIRIPHLLLQPIVENAILHGIAPKGTGGRVDVSGKVSGGFLRLEVADDGPGLPDASVVKEGIGLANTRERLAKAYGAAGRMHFRQPPGGGLAVEIILPCAP